ncbi:MAG: DUF4856 domain-containing protein [Flavobacteriales bacterium]
MKNCLLIVLLFWGVSWLSSCKEPSTLPDDEPTPVVVPPTYSYEMVAIDDQLELLDQLDEMVAYMRTSEQPGVEINAAVLKSMFENTGGNASGNFPFSSDAQMKGLCQENALDMLEGYFGKFNSISSKVQTGSSGVAGWVVSSDSNRHRLFDINGFDYTQLIEKTLMGAVLYYQATEVQLGIEVLNADNEPRIDSATAMQHNWDVAYAYFGGSLNFPDDLETTRYWSFYTKILDEHLNCVEELGTALRMGREAINVERYDKRDEAIEETKVAWNKVCVGAAIHFLNVAINKMDDDFVRNNALSQAIAFVRNTQYNSASALTDSQRSEIETLIGSNLYESVSEDLVSARSILAESISAGSIESVL